MMTSKRLNKYILALILLPAIMTACSTTSAIPDGEQLFTGLKKIQFDNYEKNAHADETKMELESVLATAPTSSLLGSSYYRTPIPIRLWIWNAFSQDTSAVSRWITKAFGSKPKLLSQVNPLLRKSVGELQLKKFGYFKGNVDYDIIQQSNPKKAKVAYFVNMGPLWRLDSISYINFTPGADSLVAATKDEALIRKGDPFSVPALESERQRVARLLRNNGYYYAKPTDASYLADTLQTPGKVVLRFQEADSLEPEVTRKWYVGRVNVNLRRQFTEELTDSLVRRSFTLRYARRKSPLRPGVFYNGLKIRPGQLYSLANQEASSNYLHSTGLFTYSSFRFTPRDSSETCDTLDLDIDCVFDKPYNFYINANAKGKTSKRFGPELIMGLTKLNAFRGGEKLDINVHGSYEWQTGHQSEGSSSKVNSYEYGGDISLIVPRMLTPANLFWSAPHRAKRDSLRVLSGKKPRRRRRFYGVPSTTLRMSNNILNRAGYFKRHVVSGDLTYEFWTSPQSYHEFSPLTLSYEYMTSRTDSFMVLLADNPYLQISMRDQFVPKMSYTYQYTTGIGSRHPFSWRTTVSEAANILSLGYMAAGKQWNDKSKKLFKNPYAQFVKLETDFVKLWRFGDNHSIAGHLNAGVVYSYGNATKAPYYEQFYVGGANSVRAFNVRSIGPGKYRPSNQRMSYIEQTGDVKFVANLEFRPHLFGDLYGAVFLDAGNVWTLGDDAQRPGGKLKWKSVFTDMAVGTGVGIRYDLGLFVIRVDWGIGLHVPYHTGKKGFYNLLRFDDGNSFHLAIGYPF